LNFLNRILNLVTEGADINVREEISEESGALLIQRVSEQYSLQQIEELTEFYDRILQSQRDTVHESTRDRELLSILRTAGEKVKSLKAGGEQSPLRPPVKAQMEHGANRAISKDGDSYADTYPERIGEVIEREIQREVNSERESLIKENLERINESNIENNRLYGELLREYERTYIVGEDGTSEEGEVAKTPMIHVSNEENIAGDEVYQENVLRRMEKIEQQNTENHNQYIRALQQLENRQKQPEKKNVDPNRQFRESLKALENPDELLEDYLREETKAREEKRADKEKFLAQLPENVRFYVEAADRILSGNREGESGSGDDALLSLQRDIERAEMVNPTAVSIVTEEQDTPLAAKPQVSPVEMTHIDNRDFSENTEITHVINEQADRSVPAKIKEYIKLLEKEPAAVVASYNNEERPTGILSDEEFETARMVNALPKETEETLEETGRVINRTQAEKIVENVLGNREVIYNRGEHRTEEQNLVSLIHKETETIDEEELVNRIVTERHQVTENKEVVTEVVENTREVDHREITQQVVNEITNNRQIEELVEKGVHKQLSGISDQVYAKLERKLINEKRRRGI